MIPARRTSFIDGGKLKEKNYIDRTQIGSKVKGEE
jgi:hypothetical protein